MRWKLPWNDNFSQLITSSKVMQGSSNFRVLITLVRFITYLDELDKSHAVMWSSHVGSETKVVPLHLCQQKISHEICKLRFYCIPCGLYKSWQNLVFFRQQKLMHDRVLVDSKIHRCINITWYTSPALGKIIFYLL